MHHNRYDDLDHLKAELEQEKRYRETIEWSNAELERSIAELEAYLLELESNTRAIDDNEWKVRFESQTALNKQLQEQKDWLENELVEARRKLTTGSYPEAMNFNLDALNESELLRLVKHLERMRNDFYSTLRDTEWKLDKESKEFHHFDEMRRVYRVDVKHANQTIERLRLSQVLDTSGIISPVYPTGHGGQGGSSYRYYHDHEHSMREGGRAGSRMSYGGEMGAGASGYSKGKKGGGKSPSRNLSPSRAKSRADKKDDDLKGCDDNLGESGGEVQGASNQNSFVTKDDEKDN